MITLWNLLLKKYGSKDIINFFQSEDYLPSKTNEFCAQDEEAG